MVHVCRLCASVIKVLVDSGVKIENAVVTAMVVAHASMEPADAMRADLCSVGTLHVTAQYSNAHLALPQQARLSSHSHAADRAIVVMARASATVDSQAQHAIAKHALRIAAAMVNAWTENVSARKVSMVPTVVSDPARSIAASLTGSA